MMLVRLFLLPAWPLILGYTLYLCKKIVDDTTDPTALEEIKTNEDLEKILKPYKETFTRRYGIVINCYCLLTWLFFFKWILT